MNLKLTVIAAASASALLLSACSPTVSYVDPNAANTLTTNFTQNDLRAVAQDMSTQLIQSGKMNRCKTYTISPIQNQTDQYVDTSVMSNAMVDALSNSSAVKSEYVVSSQGMSNQTSELDRQNSKYYNQNTSAKVGKMIGAQCRIDGKLTSDTSVSPNGKTILKSYTFFVQMFNVQTGAAVWRNSKDISKQQSN
jgi:uncharacterized protein (TIGR02722 family)